MARFLYPLLVLLPFLAACDGTNPFMVLDEETPEVLEPGDPNTDVNSKFLWSQSQKLTMNSVTYDAANDDLIINNLPFDGPEGRYDRTATAANGAQIYRNRTTTNTGQVTHYAVFIDSGTMQATAAAGVNWISYGNAGANVTRQSFTLPSGGEYVYTGIYAGIRSFDEKSGIELTAGDVELLVDISEFEPLNGIQGDIVGTVSGRTRVNFNGSTGRDLPSIILAEVSFNTADGTFDDGNATTINPFTNAVWSAGKWSGFLSGAQGLTNQQIGAYLVIEGVADIQRVTYQTIFYTAADGSTGSTTGQTEINEQYDDLQSQINAGLTLQAFFAAPPIPAGATQDRTTTGTVTFQTEYNAREIGVLVGDCRAPCDGIE